MNSEQSAMSKYHSPRRAPIARCSLLIAYCIVFCLLLIASCGNPFMGQILQPKTASFESNGGSPVAEQTLFRGETINRPANPLRSGYNFSGWYRDNDNFAALWNFDLVPPGDITLYARWEAEARVIGITIRQQPANLIYTHGDPLDLAGLEVTLIFDDDSIEYVAFADFSARNISADPAHGTALVRAVHGGKPVTVSVGAYRAATSALTVNRAAGAEVAAPTVNFITETSITVNAVAATATGQAVEFAISTAEDGTGLSAWQSGLTFSGLVTDQTYFVYARSAQNQNFYAGAPHVSAPITVVQTTGSITLTVQDFIDHAPSLAEVHVSITGNGLPYTYLVLVDPYGFDANPPVAWAISGTDVTGTGPSFTVDARDTRYNTVGTRQLTVRVYKGGIPYQGTVLVHIAP